MPRAQIPAAGECHLWPASLASLGRLSWPLSEDERRRAASIRGDAARRDFVASRCGQRLVLARYLGASPGSIGIERGCALCGDERHGRPYLPGSALDFSVSHAGRWLLVAVTAAGRIGVDLEARAGLGDPGDLAGFALSPAELARFNLLPEPDRPDWLLRTWTRKEAALKVTGLGISGPLDQVDVSGSETAVPGWPGGPIGLRDVAAPDGMRASLASSVPIRSVLLSGPVTDLVTSGYIEIPGIRTFRRRTRPGPGDTRGRGAGGRLSSPASDRPRPP